MLAYSHHPSRIAAWPLVIIITALAACLVSRFHVDEPFRSTEAADTVKPLFPSAGLEPGKATD
jgi:integral membrane sensor domain MASE1